MGRDISYRKVVLQNKVGFASIPDQIREKSIEDGFRINVLVVGRRGLGAKTLVNSLFGCALLSGGRGDEIHTVENEIVENSVKLRVGLSTYHNMEDTREVIDVINSRYGEYLLEEQLIFERVVDRRIHVVLFLIPGDENKKADIDLLNKLSQITNVIPIVAKADSYTEEEMEKLKRKLGKEIVVADCYCNIMAVTASENEYDFNGILARGRKYGWGFVPVEEVHDFSALQRMVVYNEHEELRQKIDQKFYQKYRQANGKEGDREAVFGRLVDQMEQMVGKKFEEKKAAMIKEEIDIEKFISATKLNQFKSTMSEIKQQF
ncbi:CDC10 [Enterospora canceri]|uniref:CDC10 n=1 Tax=Enterospora canceri TaxID=1081671 RepID=A0A1Y1S7V5_9MICR|nr:CDC10 [Enterospora canceri]